MRPRTPSLRQWAERVVSNRATGLALLLLCVLALTGSVSPPPQIYIDVHPPEPTTEDDIQIELYGQWPHTCIPSYQDHWVAGQDIYIYGETAHTNCQSVPLDWSFTAHIGQLEAGYYTVHGYIQDNYHRREYEKTKTFEVRGGAALWGIIFEDTDRDGEFDTNEPRLPWVEVALREEPGGRDLETWTTGYNGMYEFSNLEPGTYYIVVTDPSGYVPTTPTVIEAEAEAGRRIWAGDVGYITEENLTPTPTATSSPTPTATSTGTSTPTPTPSATPTPTLQPGQPVVQRVQPCFAGAYWLQGAHIDNRFTAFVDWRGRTPGHVDFILNGELSHETPSGDTASHTYDMGSDLRYRLLGIRNELKAVATSAEGVTSEPYVLSPIGFDLPAWTGRRPPVSLSVSCLESPSAVARFAHDLRYPDPPFEANVNNPPGWFPFIGGHPFGLRRTQAQLHLEATSDGTGLAKLSGQTGFDVSDTAGVTGQCYGQGKVSVGEGQGLNLTEATLGLGLSGEVKAQRPLVDVICKAFTSGSCPLKEAEGILGVGNTIKAINERAQVEAKVEPRVNAKASFHSTASGWQWDGLSGGGSAETTLALILELLGVKAKAYGSGTPSIELQVPADPSYLREAAAELTAGIKFTKWGRVIKEVQADTYRWSHVPDGAQMKNLIGVQASLVSEGLPISRTYAANPETYSVFRAGTVQPLMPSTEAVTAEQELIASNVYPDADPALAVNNTKMLLLWTHDDVNKPQLQGEEIRYTFYDGISWGAPAGITDDNLQDFTPQVAFDNTGQAVAVWERNKVVQSTDSEFDADYTNAFDIAYAVWDGSVWTAPAYLTSNNVLDHAPVLIRGSDGTLLLIWRQNAAGELLGTVANPDKLFYALWNGTSWSTPTAFVDDAGGVLGVTAARHNGSRMAVVYSRDTDGDLGTGWDQELYLVGWDGDAWRGPTRLTDDAQPDSRPTLFYDDSGNPRLLWLKGETLYALLGDLTGEPEAVVVGGSAGILDYTATQDDAGNLVLLWQGYSAEGVDAFYASYDQANDVFSLVEQLTHDEPVENAMAPAFVPTGDMLMAYNKTALVTETVEISPTLVISDVTTFGQTDLYVLRHTFASDLMLEAAGLVVAPANPAPGSTARIRATLRNAGDRAVVNPKVTFYLGDPADDTPIGTATADLTLAGGMTTTLSTDWTVPTSDAPFDLYAVADPDGTVDEQNETNNEAFITTVVPDLSVSHVWVEYGSDQVVTLTAIIGNTGVVPAQANTVAFRLNSPDGPTVAEAAVGNVSVGSRVKTSAVWDVAGVTTDWHTLYAVADASRIVAEVDETNNSNWVSVGVLPDLAIRPVDVSATFEEDSVRVTATVHNEGVRDASGVSLGLYGLLPQLGDVPRVHQEVDVPARGATTATLTWSGAWWPGLYLGVNASGVVPERDVSNNIALIGETPYRLRMPLVLRRR